MLLLLQGLSVVLWYVQVGKPRFWFPLAVLTSFVIPLVSQFLVVMGAIEIVAGPAQTAQKIGESTMKDEERAKLWRTLPGRGGHLGTLCVVYGFYVNQVIWTAAGFTCCPSRLLFQFRRQ